MLRMKRHALFAVSTIVMAVVGLGCEDAAKKPVQAHVPGTPVPGTQMAQSTRPASAPSKAMQQAPLVLAPLPLTDPKRPQPKSLLPPVPEGKAYLVQKVQEKFTSGEKNFKAGHLEAARHDFDDAVDWLLESGYDPES